MDAGSAEEWRDIPGYEGHYQASNLGRIRSLDRHVRRRSRYGKPGLIFKAARIIKARSGEGNYRHLRLTLRRDGHVRTWTVHALVALAFLGSRPPGMEVCHSDGDWLNNRLENLRYGTHSDNMRDMVRHGTHAGMKKTRCPSGHLLSGNNLCRNDLARGRRRCRACRCAHNWVSKLKRRHAIRVTDDERKQYGDMKYLEFAEGC